MSSSYDTAQRHSSRHRAGSLMMTSRGANDHRIAHRGGCLVPLLAALHEPLFIDDRPHDFAGGEKASFIAG